MVWSTPHLFAVSEVVSAATMNTYVSDNLQWLYDNRFDVTSYGVTPLAGLASGNLTLTTSYQDVAGATVTLGGTGKYVLFGTVRIETSVAGTRTVWGRLVINAVAQTGIIELGVLEGQKVGQSRYWPYTAASAGLVAKLQALHSDPTLTDVVMGQDTRLMAWQVTAP